LGVVLIGTLYPLIAQAMGVQLSIGPPFFDKAAVPVALALVVVTMAGPMLKWRRDDLRVLGRRLAVPGAVAAVAPAGVPIAAPGIGVLPLLGLVFAAGLAIASVAPLWKRNLRRTPLHVWGMVVAHLGIAVSMAGMASDSAFTRERLIAARIGESVQ